MTQRTSVCHAILRLSHGRHNSLCQESPLLPRWVIILASSPLAAKPLSTCQLLQLASLTTAHHKEALTPSCVLATLQPVCYCVQITWHRDGLVMAFRTYTINSSQAGRQVLHCIHLRVPLLPSHQAHAYLVQD